MRHALFLTALVAAAALGGCGSGAGRLATCGRVPVTPGPYHARFAATLTAPRQARSGTTVRATFRVRVRKGDRKWARHLPSTSPLPADLVIARGGHIVGYYDGAVAASGYSDHPGRHSAAGRLSILLKGCPARLDLQHPDRSRRALPPGRYQLVAAFGYYRPQRGAAPGYSSVVAVTTPIDVTS